MRHLILFYLIVLPLFTIAQKPKLITPIGHTNPITSVDVSSDGKYLVTGSYDQTAKLWDFESGQLIHTFKSDANWVRAVKFSPDCPSSKEGKSFLTAGDDHIIKLWATQSSKLVREFIGHTDSILSVDFSPNCQEILSGSGDKTAILWNAQTATQIETFQHNDVVTSVRFSPNGKRILTCSKEKKAVLWDYQPQKRIREFSCYSIGEFSINGKFVFTNSGPNGELVEMFDAKTGQSIKKFKGHRAQINAIALSEDGKHMATGSSDHTAIIWDIETGQAKKIIEAHNFAIYSLVFTPMIENKQYIITGSRDYTAKMWDAQNGQFIKSFEGHSQGALSFTPLEKSLLINYDNIGQRIWDLESGQLLRISDKKTINIPGRVVSENGRYTLTIGSGNSKQSQSDNGFLDRAGAIGITGIEGFFGSNTKDTLFLWETNTGRKVRHFLGQENKITRAVISADSQKIAAGFQSGNVQLWDKNSGESTTFKGDPSPINSLSISANGQYIVAGNSNLKVLIWKTASGALLHDDFLPHNLGLNTVACAPNGKYLLTGSNDRTAKLWDLESGALLQTLDEHDNRVTSVAFGTNTDYLITASFIDQSIKLWSLENDTAKAMATLSVIDTSDWVVTTPSGLFDASSEAMKRMHYVVNFDKAWEIIELEQLKTRYYEPGLLPKLIGQSDEYIRSVEDFNEVVLYPEVEANIKNDQLNIKLKERNGAIGRVSVFLNNKEIALEADSNHTKSIQFDLKNYHRFLYRNKDSTNTVTIHVYNKDEWLKSPAINLNYEPTALQRGGANVTNEPANEELGGESLDPKMYVVCIGTSNYSGQQLDLRYADQDATMMAKALNAVGSALFSNGDSLEVFCLSTASKDSTGLENTTVEWKFANKKNIQSTFDQIKSKAKAEDVIVVYLSGHGITYGSAEKAQFYYLTQGTSTDDLSDPGIRKAYTLSTEELTRWINNIAALKQVLIIDACNSGKIVEDLTGGTKALNSSQIRALDRMKDRTGMFIISGSAADKVSYEASEFGQGLLTYALLQGMRMPSVLRETAIADYVDIMELFQHARDEVPELAKSINGLQTPMLGFPKEGASIDIGILNETSINAIPPLADKKPVLVRSIFLSQDSFDDDLNLGSALEQEFKFETEKGKDAKFVYIDVNEYPGAFALRGFYSQKNGTITIKLKNGNEPIDLDIRFTEDPESLANRILRAVKKELRNIPGT